MYVKYVKYVKYVQYCRVVSGRVVSSHVMSCMYKSYNCIHIYCRLFDRQRSRTVCIYKPDCCLGLGFFLHALHCGSVVPGNPAAFSSHTLDKLDN